MKDFPGAFPPEPTRVDLADLTKTCKTNHKLAHRKQPAQMDAGHDAARRAERRREGGVVIMVGARFGADACA